MADKNDNLTGAKQIAEHLQISVTSLWRMRKQYRDMPCRVITGGLSASKKRLDRWRDRIIRK